MEDNKGKQIKNFILDVDGVLNDGRFYYTAEGKVAKVFGPDDHDALLLLKPYINICMVTGDKKGFAITKKRIEDDMHFPLFTVSTFDRADWISKKFDLNETAYMGDGIFDSLVFDEVAYSIAPANAFYLTKTKADFVTLSKGGEGAVAEACLHIMEKFLDISDPINLALKLRGGEWGK